MTAAEPAQSILSKLWEMSALCSAMFGYAVVLDILLFRRFLTSPVHFLGSLPECLVRDVLQPEEFLFEQASIFHLYISMPNFMAVQTAIVIIPLVLQNDGRVGFVRPFGHGVCRMNAYHHRSNNIPIGNLFAPEIITGFRIREAIIRLRAKRIHLVHQSACRESGDFIVVRFFHYNRFCVDSSRCAGDSKDYRKKKTTIRQDGHSETIPLPSQDTNSPVV
jgi:hypothetical protein